MLPRPKSANRHFKEQHGISISFFILMGTHLTCHTQAKHGLPSIPGSPTVRLTYVCDATAPLLFCTLTHSYTLSPLTNPHTGSRTGPNQPIQS
jgi:hypothetical protein